MNKAELKKKWFKYCDTDKLVDYAMELFADNEHAHSEHGVCTMLDTFFKDKEPIIKLMITSKNYVGNLRIVVKKDFDRQVDLREVRNCLDKFRYNINLDEMLRYSDEDGKDLFDHLAAGHKAIELSNMPSAEEKNAKTNLVRMFEPYTRATIESCNRRHDFCCYLDHFKNISSTKIPADYTRSTERKTPTIKAGTKTSRAFNKVCNHYGIDKLNPQTVTVEENGVTTTKTVYPYDKFFAEYADLVSDLTRQMYFVISVNPLDYLTMSVGVNWHSCHHIRSGGYKGGCMSYMLDSTSLITYVVTELSDPLHKQPKVYRQMFHYDNGLFIQSRLYPQGNDGATDLYAKFRCFMIEEFTNVLNVDAQWTEIGGTSECGKHITHSGTHYPDYEYNSGCTTFYPTTKAESVRDYVMHIGHKGICVRCGKEYSSSARFCHRYQNECDPVELEDWF